MPKSKAHLKRRKKARAYKKDQNIKKNLGKAKQPWWLPIVNMKKIDG